MLLTLTASCLRSMLTAGRGKKPKLDLLDLPTYARETLGLAGINLSTDLLVGADRSRLESVRERADRASCACLLLVEADIQPFGATQEKASAGAVERMLRVVEAAHILGCSAAAVRIEANDDDATFARVASRLKPVMERAEKLDINLLISPAKGLTARPERVTELLKKVGGFRIGTYPDFQTASESKDPVAYMQRLTPYATAVAATTVKFTTPAGGELGDEDLDAAFKHAPYELKPLVDAVISVGYDGPLALDYRGGGDVTMGLARSRDAIMATFGEPEDEEEALDIEE
jgi:sugar phosphate isomerase/epimerase